MTESKIGRATARIFSLMGFLLGLASLVALVTFALNSLEIASIFSRWFGAGVIAPFLAFAGTALASLATSNISRKLLQNALMVESQERIIND